MNAHMIFTVDPEYAKSHQHGTSIEEYAAWCQENNRQYWTAVARNVEEVAILQADLQRKGHIIGIVEGNLPDNFNEFTLPEGLVEQIKQEREEMRKQAIEDIANSHRSEPVFGCKPEALREAMEPVRKAIYGEEEKEDTPEECEAWGYFKYLQSMGGSERHDFDNHQEAYDFGNKLRDNIAAECYQDKIKVSIGATTVRVEIEK